MMRVEEEHLEEKGKLGQIFVERLSTLEVHRHVGSQSVKNDMQGQDHELKLNQNKKILGFRGPAIRL